MNQEQPGAVQVDRLLRIEQRLKRLTLIFVLVSAGFFVTTAAFATKPMVSVSDCVERADVVAVIRVRASSVLAKQTQSSDGSWSVERRKVEGQVKKSLKGTISKRIVFECEGLTFEKGHDYIVFLRSRVQVAGQEDSQLRCIDSPNRLVEATRESEKDVQEIIKGRDRTTNR